MQWGLDNYPRGSVSEQRHWLRCEITVEVGVEGPFYIANILCNRSA